MSYILMHCGKKKKENGWARMYQVSSSVITAVGQQCRLPRVKNDCLMENLPKKYKNWLCAADPTDFEGREECHGSSKYINDKTKNKTKSSFYSNGELCHIC